MIRFVVALCLSCMLFSSIPSADGHDYYPLTEGSSWLYRDVYDTGDAKLIKYWIDKTKSGISTEPVQIREMKLDSDDLPATHWFDHDEWGDIIIDGITLPGGIYFEWDFHWILLPKDLYVGKIWTNRDEVSDPKNAVRKVNNIHDCRIVSMGETVSTDSGEFTNCVKVTVSSINSDGEIWREVSSYYAKGIGLVLYITSGSLVKEKRRELIEYVIK